KHFKELTSLTPGQYQKRLRLIEARRLMLYQGSTASNAAYAVGYESVPHFTRDYRQMFGAPPAQDIRNTERLAHGRRRSRQGGLCLISFTETSYKLIKNKSFSG